MIELITNKGKCKVLISDEDADLKDIKWSVIGPGYAYHRSMGYLHIVILERIIGRKLVNPEKTDHKDRNRLNCQRDNIRLATSAQNGINKAIQSNNKVGFKGVIQNRYNHNKWDAKIGYQGKSVWIGSYDSPEEASKAYDQKAIELYGEFAATSDKNAKAEIYSPNIQHDPDYIKGVSFNKQVQKWHVQLTKKGITKFFGQFVDKKDADKAYQHAVDTVDEWCLPPDKPKRPGLRPDNNSGARGVSWDAKAKMWWARTTIDGKRVSIGYFETVELAVEAQNKAKQK